MVNAVESYLGQRKANAPAGPVQEAFLRLENLYAKKFPTLSSLDRSDLMS